MHVPNWKNVLGVSAVVRCVWRVPNWKNVLCCKMCMVTSGMSRCHARSTTFDARVGNTSDARVARSYHKNFPVSRYLYDLAISGQEKCPGRHCHKMCMVTLGMSRCHARSTTSYARVCNTSDTRVCLYVFVYVYVCLEIVQKTTLHTLQILLAVYRQLS